MVCGRIAAHVRNAENANAMCRILDRTFKRLDHLVEGDETEPGCRLPRGWNALEQPIGRFQQIRPPPSRAENVPRSKDRR